ncbi:MAG: dihydrolipoyl dehydrogenase [Syntrophales bacterium]|nr:dihydrolipoyl dehydrogenase [Syntrophales bacterium]
MMVKDLRLIVIGGGVAGYPAAIRAAREAANVTLIEKDALGGTCLNRGCIPTKVFLQAAETLRSLRRAETLGIHAENVTFNFLALQRHKTQIIGRLRKGVEALLKVKKVRIMTGSARLEDERSVSIVETGEKLVADRIIIASGSVPLLPPFVGCDGRDVATSDEFLAAATLPKRVCIIGGGVVGVEFAQFFQAVGVETTIIEALPGLLPGFDKEMAKTVEATLRKTGIAVITSASVVSLAPGEVIYRDAAGQIQHVKVEKVLLAVGRRPYWDGIEVEALGIATAGGAIVVNSRMETNIPGIYAAGDVIGGPMLAHLAAAQGECAAVNALGGDADIRQRAVPSCVYTTPELASVGMTEEEAVTQEGDIEIGRFPFRANGKAHITGDVEGFVKIIAGREGGRILGVHILAPHATEMIAEAALAMTAGLTVRALAHTIHPHPTLSEAIMEAAMGLAGGAIHLP